MCAHSRCKRTVDFSVSFSLCQPTIRFKRQGRAAEPVGHREDTWRISEPPIFIGFTTPSWQVLPEANVCTGNGVPSARRRHAAIFRARGRFCPAPSGQGMFTHLFFGFMAPSFARDRFLLALSSVARPSPNQKELSSQGDHADGLLHVFRHRCYKRPVIILFREVKNQRGQNFSSLIRSRRPFYLRASIASTHHHCSRSLLWWLPRVY